MGQNLYTIGEVARRSGVPIKTIRFYSDFGLLPPSDVTEAGYRLYSDGDRLRLELIRTLRSLSFDLPTIRRLLKEEVSTQDAVKLQLDALEMQMRSLKRQQAVLKAALEAEGAGDGEGESDEAVLAYLSRSHGLARLDAMERQQFVREHIERALDGIPVHPDFAERIWKAALADLPDTLSEQQLEAWLELAALVSDESFMRRLGELSKPFWERVDSDFSMQEWNVSQAEIFARVTAAREAGELPERATGQQIVADYIALNARALGRVPDAEFEREMLEMQERGSDPRAERFWELVGVLRGWEGPSPITIAHAWLMSALRWRVEHQLG
jgi:DNA-binding transcriptional MerR regulator